MFKRFIGACFILGILFNIFFNPAAGQSLIKPELDQREYRMLTLPNKMRVTLISDKEAKAAAASINIKVGCYEDPDDIPGMAHFLEHMLFLGTQKYPDSDAFNRYLQTHGGFMNAFTASDSTNFFFSINYNQFDGALDRLSQFFINPLFTESLVQRELNAINAEHSMNIQNDDARFFEVLALLARQDHPASKFCTGNQETLKNVPRLRERMLDFYKSHYSANLMHLALIGRESLDALQGYAEKYFGDVKNKNYTRKKYGWDAMNPEYLPGILHVKSLQEKRKLRLNFVLPSYIKYYADKPWRVLTALMGDESKGSLHHFLSAQNWITSLNSGFYHGDESSNFIIQMDLTEEGIEKTDEIIRHFFVYLDLVKTQGLKNWRYQEHKKIAQINFKFLEKSDPVSAVMHITTQPNAIAFKDTLYANYRFETFNIKQLNNILRNITPKRMLVAIQAQNLETDQKEKWYGTDFLIKKPKPSTQKAWEKAFAGKMKNDSFKLPVRNNYIPNDVRLIPKKIKSDIPKIIYDKDGIVFWHFKDDRFKQLKSHLRVDFEIPSAYSSPLNTLMTKIIINIWKEKLRPELYLASVAGYNVNLDFLDRGMTLSLNGYNEKTPLLLEKILKVTKNIDIDKERFDAIKDDLMRHWKNIDKDSALNLAFYDMQHLAMQKNWYKDDYQAIGKQLTYEDVQRFHQTFFSNLSLNVFLYGNTSTSLQEDIRRHLQKRFQFIPLFEDQWYKNRFLNFDNGKDYVYSLKAEDKDSAVVLLFQGDTHDLKAQQVGNILGKIIQAPFFEQLRTQEQLGYIVGSTFYAMDYIPTSLFFIQSPEKDPIYLKQRIKKFLTAFEKELKDLPDEALESVKEATINQLKEDPKTSGEAFGKFWGQIENKDFEFESQKIAIKIIESITKDDIINLYQRLILDENNSELTIMSWGDGFKQKTPIGTLIEKPLTSFKRQHSFFGVRTFEDVKPDF